MGYSAPPLPKASSQAFKELNATIARALDLPRAVVVLEGALDRRVLEETLQRLTKGRAGRLDKLPRPELVGHLAQAFLGNEDAAYALMRELDKACAKERSIVASIDEGAVEERLSSYRALDFRRERARMVWALLRDGRAAHAAAADRVLQETFEGIRKATEAEAALRGEAPADERVLDELKQRLDGYEQALTEQQQEIVRTAGDKESVEKDRSELLARLATRERALRQSDEQRQQALQQAQALQREVQALTQALEALEPGRVAAILAELDSEKARARVLEEQKARAELSADRAAELAAELAALRRAHDDEKRAWERESIELLRRLEAAETLRAGAEERSRGLKAELRAARQQLAGGPQPLPKEGLRVGVFLDEANLSASARREFGSKLDYHTLVNEVMGERVRGACVAFVVKGDVDEGAHAGFLASLRQCGFEIREKRPKVRADGSRKADWDMGIAMEVLDRLDDLDVVALLSGDGDFLPLVKRVRREGKRVEVAAFRASTDEALIKGVDAYVALDGRFRLTT